MPNEFDDKKAAGAEDKSSKAPELSTLELEQKAKGWQPLAEWEEDGNDPKDHRSAREFRDRGELLETIKSTKGELRQVTQMVNQLSDHNKKVFIAGYERAIGDLKVQRAQAIEEGDAKKLAQVEDQLDANKATLAAAKATAVPQIKEQPVISPAFTNWRAENSWYDETASMKHWAHGMAIEFAKVNPEATEAQVYAFLSKEVRKEFPDKFQKKGPPSPDGEGRSSGKATTSARGSNAFEKLMADMPEDQAKAAREMVKRGLITKEKYVEDYDAIGRNR